MKRLALLLPLLLALPAPASAQAAKEPPPATERRMTELQSIPPDKLPNFRQQMRDIVVELADYTRKRHPQFIVVMRNAQELTHKQEREVMLEEIQDPVGIEEQRYEPLGAPVRPFLRVLDGWLVDGLFCGRDEIEEPTAKDTREDMRALAEWMLHNGRPMLSIDYCTKGKLPEQTRAAADKARTMTFITRDNRLDAIPKERPRFENAEPVTSLTEARNFLPVLRSDRFGTLGEWVMALKATNHDVLVISPFHRGTEALTRADVDTLRYKSLGARRLVLAHLRLGVASDSAWYWKKDWAVGKPAFLTAPDPRQAGDFYVDYADPEWKKLIGVAIKGILDLGFDGVVLDDVNMYLYYESLTPLK